MSKPTGAVALLFIVCLTSAAMADPMFCAIGWHGEFAVIDAASDHVAVLNRDLPDYFQGMAWSADGGALYAARGHGDFDVNELYTIDPVTGAGEYVCDLPLPDDTGVRGIAISPDNTLYISSKDSYIGAPEYLSAFDLETQTLLSTVRLTGQYAHAQGLEFGPDGVLYSSAYRWLVSITLDGVTTKIGRHEDLANADQSLAFTPDGRLFGAGTHDLAEINPIDGSLIGPVFDLGDGDYRAIAYIPEPAGLVMVFALGLWAMMRENR